MEKLERSLCGIEDRIVTHARRNIEKSTQIMTDEKVRILTGPIVGEVGENFAIVLLEINVSSEIRCYISVRDTGSPEGRVVGTCDAYLRAGIPGRFVLKNLVPGQRYYIHFDGVREEDSRERVGSFQTWGGRKCAKINIALVGDCREADSSRDSRYMDTWNSLEKENQVQLVLHLGNQVQGLGHDIYFNNENLLISNVCRDLETRISAEQYRFTLNLPSVSYNLEN